MPDFRKLLSNVAGPSAAQLLSDLWRYGLCSALALAVDWGVMLVLIRLGMNYLTAASTSFLVGMAVAYVGSVVFVYGDRRSYSAATEAFGFVLVGIAGLIINALLLFIFVKFAGLSAGFAKAPTAVGVFVFNFAARRALLFTDRATSVLPSVLPVALDIE